MRRLAALSSASTSMLVLMQLARRGNTRLFRAGPAAQSKDSAALYAVCPDNLPAIIDAMTPSEKNIVMSLVAVAWADGKMEDPESGVIEGMLCGFDASEDEEQEILEYAKQRRSLDEDIPLDAMGREERELLLANAALLTHADGEVSASESALLEKLTKLLGFSAEEAKPILESVSDGALRLGSDLLVERED
jgi:uncharacterized tellurite resistance protein B-like protein